MMINRLILCTFICVMCIFLLGCANFLSRSEKKHLRGLLKGFDRSEEIANRNYLNIKRINLANTSMDDASLYYLKGFRNLKELNLYGTNIQGSGLRYLCKLRWLEVLNLGKTRITGTDLSYLSCLKKRLKKLTLIDIQLTDNGLQYLNHFKNLEHLDLAHTGITNSGIPYITQLTNLRLIDLRHTNLTLDGVKKLANILKSAQIIFWEKEHSSHKLQNQPIPKANTDTIQTPPEGKDNNNLDLPEESFQFDFDKNKKAKQKSRSGKKSIDEMNEEIYKKVISQ